VKTDKNRDEERKVEFEFENSENKGNRMKTMEETKDPKVITLSKNISSPPNVVKA